MNFIRERFVSISQANTDTIQTSLFLPFGFADTIGLNLSKIDWLRRVGGFESLRIKGVFGGQVSQIVHETDGVDEHGTALAGAGVIRTQSSAHHAIRELDGQVKQARWSMLTVHLNMAEIQQRLEGNGSMVDDQSAWIRQLNPALKSSFVRAGIDHLINGRLSEKEKNLLTFWCGASLISGIGASVITNDGLLGLGSTLLVGGALSVVNWAVDARNHGVESRDSGRRISFFFGPELDRAAVLLVVASMSDLVGTV